MSTNRDTHFQGFAKLLWDELMGEAGYIDIACWDTDEIAGYQELIAQRAYDLVAHAMADLIEKHDGNIELFDVAGQGAAFAECVPDMTAWPDTNKQGEKQ